MFQNHEVGAVIKPTAKFVNFVWFDGYLFASFNGKFKAFLVPPLGDQN